MYADLNLLRRSSDFLYSHMQDGELSFECGFIQESLLSPVLYVWFWSVNRASIPLQGVRTLARLSRRLSNVTLYCYVLENDQPARRFAEFFGFTRKAKEEGCLVYIKET